MHLLGSLLVITHLSTTLATPIIWQSEKPSSTPTPKQQQSPDRSRCRNTNIDGSKTCGMPDWSLPASGLTLALFLGGDLIVRKREAALQAHAKRYPDVVHEPFDPTMYAGNRAEVMLEIQRRTTGHGDNYGNDWIYRCTSLRAEQVGLLLDLSYYDLYPQALESCAKQYFDWTAIHGISAKVRPQSPTPASEARRARETREQWLPVGPDGRRRRTWTDDEQQRRSAIDEEEGEGKRKGEEDKDDNRPTYFSKANLDGLKAGVNTNLASINDATKDVLRNAPGVMLSTMQSAARNAPKKMPLMRVGA